MKQLAIAGASALGRQIEHHLMFATEEFRVVGFFDDFAPQEGDVIGTMNQIADDYAAGRFDCLMIGVGYKAMEFRSALLSRIRGRIPLASLVSRNAVVDPTAEISEGAVILNGSLIDQDVQVGANCFFSLGCSISHETIIGENTYCAPRVTVCGRSQIGKSCFLGANCTILGGLTVADHVTVGAGAVVTKSISEPGVYIGCPARKMFGAGGKNKE